jgi:predicted secreted protein
MITLFMQVFGSSSDNHHIHLPLGAEFEVALAEHPTAGFRWQVVSGQAPTADFVDRTPAAPGVGTMRHFRFRADEEGESVLRLELRRSWERDAAPASTFTLHLAVQ